MHVLYCACWLWKHISPPTWILSARGVHLHAIRHRSTHSHTELFFGKHETAFTIALRKIHTTKLVYASSLHMTNLETSYSCHACRVSLVMEQSYTAFPCDPFKMIIGVKFLLVSQMMKLPNIQSLHWTCIGQLLLMSPMFTRAAVFLLGDAVLPCFLSPCITPC